MKTSTGIRARVWHTRQGRGPRPGITAAPLGYVDGMSLYEYVGAKPARGTDPTGLDMMTGNEDGCPSDSGSSYYGAEYPLLTDSQDGYGATDNGLDGSGYSLGFGDGGAGEGDYGQDYSYTWGDSGPNAGQGGQGFLYDGGDGAGQSVPDYSRLCGNIGDNYGANTDDFGTVTKEPAPGSSQDPCEEILAGIQNDLTHTQLSSPTGCGSQGSNLPVGGRSVSIDNVTGTPGGGAEENWTGWLLNRGSDVATGLEPFLGSYRGEAEGGVAKTTSRVLGVAALVADTATASSSEKRLDTLARGSFNLAAAEAGAVIGTEAGGPFLGAGLAILCGLGADKVVEGAWNGYSAAVDKATSWLVTETIDHEVQKARELYGPYPSQGFPGYIEVGGIGWADERL